MPKTRISFIAIFLILTTLLSACTARLANEAQPPTDAPNSIPITSAVLPSATSPSPIPPLFTSTPIVTATPIVLKLDTPEEIKNIVEEIYKVDTQCRLDMLTEKEKPYETPSLQVTSDVKIKIY